MKVSIIGCGLIGKERIEAIQYISKNIDNNVQLICVYDLNCDVMDKIQQKYKVPIVSTISDVWQLKPDWVFIVTPNYITKDIVKQAFNNGINVVLEKPFGRTLSECKEIVAMKPDNCQLKIGFNYRFFAGIEAILKDVKEKKFGKIISINMILAHGNSPGMEKSWRFDPINGDGCMTDLLVHLLDISLQISPDNINTQHINMWKGFWNCGHEEECHALFLNNEGTIFNIQVSFNRWKSCFKLEVNGTEGYGIVEGRGRSYGPQSYRTGVRWGWLSGKSQSDSEAIVIDNYDCLDSFIKETISIFGFSSEQYPNLNCACDYINGKNIMILLEDCKNRGLK